METSQSGQRAVTGVSYLVLFVLGLLEGLIGSFQYSRGPSLLWAVILVLAIFATCVGFAWGLRSFGAGLFPALGWFIASFVLSMSRPNGSVVITATTAGETYLYGGALAAAIGASASFFARIRR
jgi:Family of unknown function (DUF6113)